MAGDVTSYIAEAARVISGPQPTDRSAFVATLAQELHASQQQLDRLDVSGAWWKPGQLAELKQQAKTDPRLRSVASLPRSITFGRMIARLFAQTIHSSDLASKSVELSQIINVFVTLMDGLCDDMTEDLPQVLPELIRAFETMDAEPQRDCGLQHPIGCLLLGIANSSFRHLRPFLRAAPADLGERAKQAIRLAFDNEVLSLQIAFHHQSVSRQIQMRESLSVSTFDATLQCLCVLECPSHVASNKAAGLAEACGRFFGWIDDVADLQSDRNTGQPNLVDLLTVQAGLAREDIADFIADETMRRWRVVEEAAGSTIAAHDLKFAARAWLI